MPDFEKLGVFYLGRPYDLAARAPQDGLTLYDAKDLVTHAVCVGMTGSGKTGLCTDLLEEAAIDGIPAIVIDPKGDMTNLMFNFPGLTAAEFRPWISEDEARNKGMTPEQFARAQAEQWQKGLAEWGQDGSRIQKLRDSADVAIYTPGSSAGLPVSILKSFSAPPAAVLDDPELLAERINTATTGLLTLLKIDADPVRSREYILISNILHHNWVAGRDLDLGGLIAQIQQPPMPRIGVIDLESVYPSAERFALAMRLNNLLAAPGFNVWLDGAPLDIDGFLYTKAGKPRISIFYIAHLSDAERMFFVSLLLGQVLGWVRSQSGTTSLRAILYMDEIFGYFPPSANPPSKTPLLTLLKQARAFGLGIVLATQNPVDLDYKGLSNCGTWFLGRLQTERDKLRVLDGLEGAATTSGGAFDRAQIDKILSALGKRIFLLHNVNKSAPEVFETRWALSYLRGPLTRDQVRTLMAPLKAALAAQPGTAAGGAAAAAAGASAAGAPAAKAAPGASDVAAGAATAATARPLLPPAISQYFAPPGSRTTAGQVVYTPMVYGAADVYYANDKLRINTSRTVSFLTPITDGPVSVDWDTALETDVAVSALEREPVANALFAALPASALRPQSYSAWRSDVTRWLLRTQTIDVLHSARLGIASNPGESERQFRIRLQQAAREKRDEMQTQLRKKYETKLATLHERKRRAEQAVQREKAQADQSRLQTALSVGATIAGAILGSGRGSLLGRATTAARGAGRSAKQDADVARAQAEVKAIDDQIRQIEREIEKAVDDLTSSTETLAERLDTVSLKPKSTGVSVRVLSLVWTPA